MPFDLQLIELNDKFRFLNNKLLNLQTYFYEIYVTSLNYK